jgi:transcriptional regulator with XRE-family HTH domain
MTAPMEVPQWTLGWRLQRSLAHAGVSMDEMAAELGISRRMVSRWINEHAQPRTAYLKVWAMRTGVPLEWLVSGTLEGVRTAPT